MGPLNLTLTPERALLLHSPIVVVADDLFCTFGSHTSTVPHRRLAERHLKPQTDLKSSSPPLPNTTPSSPRTLLTFYFLSLQPGSQPVIRKMRVCHVSSC